MKKQTIQKRIFFTGIVLAVWLAATISAFAIAKDIVGSYKTSIDMNGRAAQEFTLVVKRSTDGKLSATAEKSNDPDLSIGSIAVEGDQVTITAAWRSATFEMKGTIADDKLEGRWGSGQYSGNWSAVRIKE